ncbi:CUB-serine protease [Penaeus vannamei]|uniref:CUB-serine protease n=1 Tax=Penaeus vannamei TaxID=6689 RepID=A0A3R7P0S2_PENVA|nr:CUB-serine protease [Penaeus vannamei]
MRFVLRRSRFFQDIPVKETTPITTRGKKCTWKFRTSADSKLSIECDDFQLQQSKNCKKDFFRVTDSSAGCGQVNRANRIVGGVETEHDHLGLCAGGRPRPVSSNEANSQWMEIAEIVNHPSYDSNTLDNDIALIRLKTEIQFPSDNKIAPVCLPTAGEMYDSVDATITGWGAQQEGGYYS